MIFNKINFTHKISINIKELNSVNKIEDILQIKLNELENKCFEYGYIKEKSIEIIEKSQGFLNPIIFVPFIEYKVLCKADVFKPNIDDIYLVDVLSINKIAIMCCIKYKYNNKTIIPIRIIIAKHTQNEDVIKNIKKDDKVFIRILGYKFVKKASRIDAIANIINKNDVKDIKEFKSVIKNLSIIDHNCHIDSNKINKYTNILKFILEKDIIEYNELFVYHFIKENNIQHNNVDIENMYNIYINNFNKPINEINDTISFCNETDLTNETNPDDETYPEDDEELYEEIDDFYEYNYIEDSDKTNIYKDNDEYNEEEDEENESEDDEEIEDDEDKSEIDLNLEEKK